MGRVDEAMRRAAEAAGDTVGPPDAAEVPTLVGEDAEILAREPYPIEMMERRRLRPAPAPPAGSTIAVGPAPAEATPVTDKPANLFERIDARLARKIVIDQNMMPASREQYRRLAATLHQNQGATGLKVIMIASALGSEGKTLTASNLALTFSESYQRTVLLIDGDLRKPSLDMVFRLDGSSGLSDGLLAVDERPLTLHQISQRLTILPAGQAVSDPMAGLTSDRMRRVIEEARDAFDWVIVDTPPIGILTDANLLASMVDGVVLVVKAESTPHALVLRAIEALGKNRIVGIVLNNATRPLQGSRQDYYNYYGTKKPLLLPE